MGAYGGGEEGGVMDSGPCPFRSFSEEMGRGGREMERWSESRRQTEREMME